MKDKKTTKDVAEQVYGYMLKTRENKYKAWIAGIKKYKKWAIFAGRYFALSGTGDFKDASLRVELLEVIYIAMRMVDDIVDGDAPLPKGYDSRAVYVRALIAFVTERQKPGNEVEALLSRAFDVANTLHIDMTHAVLDVLRSLLFDAKRQEDGIMKIFHKDVLERYFHILDTRGTIRGCLLAMGESPKAEKVVRILGQATRIMYNLSDLEEDLAKGVCNITKEDIYTFDIQNLRSADTLPMRKWKHKEANRARKLLMQYRKQKYSIRLHAITRMILLKMYEAPVERYISSVLSSDAARDISC